MKRIVKEIWRAICYPLLYIGAQAVVTIAYIMAVGFGFAFQAVRDGQMPALDQMVGVMLSNLNFPLIIVISCVLTLFFLWLILRKEWKLTAFWSASGLKRSPILLCVVMGPFLGMFTGGAVHFTQLTKLFPEYDQLMASVIGDNFLIAFLGAGLLAPVAEELIFRGTILRRLKNSFKLPVALLIQAFLFGLIHGNIVQGIYAFLLGLILGIIYVWFDSIWPVIAVHAAYNTFAVVLSFLSANENAESSETVLAVMTIASLAVSAALFMLIGKKRRKEQAA